MTSAPKSARVLAGERAGDELSEFKDPDAPERWPLHGFGWLIATPPLYGPGVPVRGPAAPACPDYLGTTSWMI